MYTDIDIYPDDETDAMRIDYTTPKGVRYSALFYEVPITPDVTRIKAFYVCPGCALGDFHAKETNISYGEYVASLIEQFY